MSTATQPADPPTADDGGFQCFSIDEHARKKSMWSGSLTPATIPGLCGAVWADVAAESQPADGDDGDPGAQPPATRKTIRRVPIHREHTPGLLKIIDELVVNASDHYKEHAGAGRARVTRISLEFDPVSGQVIVENDGPGIPVTLHGPMSAREKHDVYLPEIAFAHFLSGRSMDKAATCVKGGVNGVGAKLANVHSASFEVETVADMAAGAADPATGALLTGPVLYTQAWTDRKTVRHPPTIVAAKKSGLPAERKRPHTRITMTPAYAELGYPPGPAGPLQADAAADLEAWCRWRMCLTAAYVGKKVATTFNGEPVPTPTAMDLARLVVAGDPDAVLWSLPAKAAGEPYAAHPWDVAIAVSPRLAKFAHLSVVNGVNCAKGPHITHLRAQVADAANVHIARALKVKAGTKPTGAAGDPTRQVLIVMVGALPGADWGGQRKDELQVSAGVYGSYAFPAKGLKELAGVIADTVLLRAAGGDKASTKRKVVADKYVGARKAGAGKGGACRLLLGEGDSAISLLRAILTRKGREAGSPSLETHGIFSLGGVTMNPTNHVTTLATAGGGEAVMVRSDRLRNNKVLSTLALILGLDYTCKYATAAERAGLRYGGVVVCTDQDLDGVGKILPLVLVWFRLFWPGLVAAGYVRCLVTPVIRAYPRGGGEPAEFAYENEFEVWAAGLPAPVAKTHAVKYYKGLGGHDAKEVQRIARTFADHVYAITYSAADDALFDAYYSGACADERKAILATPVAYPSLAETAAIHAAREISCETVLTVNAKAFKLATVERQLPGVCDGIPITRRKVLAASLRRFAASNQEIKIFQLGGYAAEHLYYHHGDASLNGTITGMAQRFPGALHFPYLSGIGQFGTRAKGGNDAASARYISVRLAGPWAHAMLPADDAWTLPHVYEEGLRAQPQTYVPVLPAALLESFKIPTEGWCHNSFARDFDQVVALVRAYIAGDPAVARVAAAAEAAEAGAAGKLRALAALLPGMATDIWAMVGKYPLAPSTEGYGAGLAAADRCALVRPVRGVPHSFGWYQPAGLDSARPTIRVTELPIGEATESFLKTLAVPARARLIAEVIDDSGEAEVDIRVVLQPGAMEAIASQYGDHEVDPVEDFLLLRKSLAPHLNYYGEAGGVLAFGADYHAVLLYWASRRRDLYRARYERERAVVSLRLEFESDIQRYLESGANVAALDDDAAAAAALTALGFRPYNSGLLAAPQYTPAGELEALVRGPGASFDYILNLRERERLASDMAKRAKAIARLQARLATVEGYLAEAPFAGASVWAAEVDAAVAAVGRGRATDWTFAGPS